MQMKTIRILVADESLPFITAFRQAISKDPSLKIIGTAGSWEEMQKEILELRPNVLILSSAPLGGQNPVTVMGRVHSVSHHIPMIMIGSGKLLEKEAAAGFSAEYIQMPDLRKKESFSAFSNEICVKVKLLANPFGMSFSSPPNAYIRTDLRYHVIAIGASTGGTEATAQIMESLPKGMPGVVIVQHMPASFTRMYAERLNRISQMEVSEAKNGDRIERGKALVAAGGLHMYLKKDAQGYYVRCAEGEKVNGHCPSVGVLFDSVAETAGSDAIGVILTGMGRDGAEGLLHMKKAGAYTVGQDQESCVVYGMPMAAYELGAVMKQAPCQAIAGILAKQVKADGLSEK
jgi:two-component system chemotaxis response regulator CheB